MCGRFSSTSQLQFLLEQFRAEPLGVEGHQPSWNVAPASDILVVTASEDGARQLRELRWGLVPRWAKDPSGANRMINLRAETVREKKGWKSTLARKRCIIPIDGFYEWQDQGKGQRKQPFYITSRDFSPIALAGLWATWRDPDSGEELFTCTILTTSANDLMESVHHRMPVILAPEDWDAWLDPSNTDTDELAKLLVPAPEDMLTLWPVDPAVGNVRNNRPELQEPLEGHQPITA
ncbi:MAG TPA: SOS response-associated peptidase [Actinomycetota bacterium]|jgi:putative SOS response-associated peptidase YedK|nr:SOS response-associated peptidase [Actinomycetota bacterium]